MLWEIWRRNYIHRQQFNSFLFICFINWWRKTSNFSKFHKFCSIDIMLWVNQYSLNHKDHITPILFNTSTLLLTIALRHLSTASTAMLSVSCRMLFHSLTNDAFRDAILLWDIEHDFVSNLDQTQKSRVDIGTGRWPLFPRNQFRNFIS